MADHNWVVELFQSIDDKNIDLFSSFLGQNCIFRFGNQPAVKGADEVSKFVAAFFDSIHSLKHEISESWFQQDAVICHGMVSYTRHDQSVLTVPFSNIFRIENDKVNEYLIFADTSQLYR